MGHVYLPAYVAIHSTHASPPDRFRWHLKYCCAHCRLWFLLLIGIATPACLRVNRLAALLRLCLRWIPQSLCRLKNSDPMHDAICFGLPSYWHCSVRSCRSQWLGLYYYSIWIFQQINQLMRVQLIDRLQAQSLSFHANARTGDAIYRVYQDSAMVTAIIRSIFLDPLMFLGRYFVGVVIVAAFDPVLALYSHW
ncbi:MAG: hypothetical protein CM1200mP41_38920 [Gammaproteobacteria bacterium]|nr:MAG: hypothetical protein CM1200mP41_38920 [Gammaproteobacteria bacterium]